MSLNIRSVTHMTTLGFKGLTHRTPLELCRGCPAVTRVTVIGPKSSVSKVYCGLMCELDKTVCQYRCCRRLLL